MKSILDTSFKYTPAASTDLRKTFKRIRREQAEREAQKTKPVEPVNVVHLATNTKTK